MAVSGAAAQPPEGGGADGVPFAAGVAVVPFANVSEIPADDWIGAGIAEAIAAGVAHGGLRVVELRSPAAAGAWAALVRPGDADRLALEAGRRAGARWIVVGGFQRLGDRIRITARLTDARTGAVVRTVRLDGVLTELFDLQDQLEAWVLETVRHGGAAAKELPAAPGSAAPAAGPLAAVEPPSARDPAPVAEPLAAIEPSLAIGPPVAEPAPPAGRGGAAGVAAWPGPVVIDGPLPPVAPATSTRDESGRVTLRAVRLDAPLRVDGALDEAVYGTVPPAGEFVQQLPDEGAPATERTEVWVFYDERSVYVGARCWDSAPPSAWTANEMRRDSFQLLSNDNFAVAFDTFYDRRNGVGFLINSLGGFFDYQITDESNPNRDWNPVWDVRTGRFDGGWTVELEVPFRSLRYRPAAPQTWGVQFGRYVVRKNEYSFLTPVPITAFPGILRLSAAASLVGIEPPTGGLDLEVKPYAIGGLATDLNAAPDPIVNEAAGDYGIDVKYGVTDNLTADLTYNTDFAQVEVDEQQVNLTRFSLFFPEKREFFLEGQGIFDFGRSLGLGGGGGPGGGGRPTGGGGFFGGGEAPTIFFSRRIGLTDEGRTVPILGGGRLTGKVGRFSIGAVNIQTGDETGGAAPATNFSVLRIKGDILRRSRVGMIFTGRSESTEGPGSNEVYGVDAAFSFYDNVNFTGYYARSRTPGREGDDASYQGAFSYTGDLYAVEADHLRVGSNFNPEIGFLRRDDFRRTFVQGRYSPRPRSIEAVRQFTFGASLDYILNGANRIETRLGQLLFQTELENSDRISIDVQESYELIVEPFEPAGSDVRVPAGAYGFTDVYLSYWMGAQRRYSGSLSFQHGGFFNGEITALGYSWGRVEITPRLSVEPGVSVNRIDLPAGAFTATLVTSRVTYTFTPRMFLGGLLQYISSTGAVSSNLRFRWEYSPGSELFVVYTDQRDAMARGFPRLENRALIVKINRLFRL